MPPILPTTLAVSDAIAHYRHIRSISLDELAYLTLRLEHELPATVLADMERGVQAVTVDDLMVLAVALQTTPALLLLHTPAGVSGTFPDGDQPLATGLPIDITRPELRAWIEGRTGLDPQSRLEWYGEYVGRLRVLAAHHEEQLGGARDQLRGLHELDELDDADGHIDSDPDDELDTPTNAHLEDRVAVGEYALNQTEVALAMAEQHLGDLSANTP